MKNILKIITNDFKNFTRYRIIHMTLIVSLIFALAMGFFPDIEPLLYVYLTVFVIPVIMHSITLFIEKEEGKLMPEQFKNPKIGEIISGKILSPLLLQLIPLIMYLIVMIFVLNVNFNLLLFSLAYLVGALIHILIGFSITILSRTHLHMMLLYVGYIAIFSFIPFISLMGLIPTSIEFLFVFSPGYLVGIIIENITFTYLFSPLYLVIIACILIIIYIVALILFIISPFYKKQINN
ncbi:MAG: hypothetical protein PHZ28_02360 [Candidatus Izemoplasmatales bacterium]|nr:hypothetical protein [Candidatus Izemoplasmatales bacterium]